MKSGKRMSRHRGVAKTWVLIGLIVLLALAVPAGLYYVSTISFSNGTTGSNLATPDTGIAQTPAPAPITAANATPAQPAVVSFAAGTPTGRTIKGRTMDLLVVDGETKQPLAQMHVQSNGSRRFTGTTDATGHCAVPMPADPKNPNNFFVRVNGKNYVPKRLAWQPWNRDLSGGEVPTSYTMAMDRGVTIGGKIVDDAGQPVQGAHVYVSFDARSGNGHEMTDLSPFNNNKQTVSGADGTWTYTGAPANCNQIGLTAWDYHHVSEDFWNTQPYSDTAKLYAKTAVYVLQRGYTFSGKVVDPQGAPVAGATVFRGQSSMASNDIPPQKTDAEGNFSYQFGPGQQVVLTVQAHGFAPQAKQMAMGSANQSMTFQLGLPHRISGKVVDAGGRPVANAEIVVQNWQNVRSLNERFNTDGQGNFHWNDAPAEPVTVSIYAPGVREINNQTLTPDVENTITLGKVSRVRGTVTDAATGQPIENFKLTLGIKWPNQDNVTWQPGWDGNWGVRAGAFNFENTWDYPGIAVRITAQGYLPTDSPIIKPDEGNVTLDLKMKPGKDLVFTVLSADGAPVADAQAVMATPGQQAQINNGEVRNFMGQTNASDQNGKIDFPPQTGLFKVVVTAPEGFAEFDQADLAKSDQIHLAHWGAIKGRMMLGSKPAADQFVDINSVNTEGYDQDKPNIFNNASVKTDSDGVFEVDRIAPGKWMVGRRVPVGANMSSSVTLTTVDVAAGQTVSVNVGGTGRPVVGKVILPPGLSSRTDWTYGFCQINSSNPMTAMRPPMPESVEKGSPEDRQKWFQEWRKSDEGKKFFAALRAQQQNMRSFPVVIGADGTFRADDVPAGNYTININLSKLENGNMNGQQFGFGNGKFTMPEIPGGRSDEPLQIDPVTVTTMEKYKVGDSVFDLPLRMTDGKSESLSGFRGKYILLDILKPQDMASTPYAAVAADYGKDSRLVMLTILPPPFAMRSMGATTDKNPGLQATVIPGNGSMMVLGTSFDGSVWLIGPDQKVVAEDLSGDGIRAAVVAALGSAQPEAETPATQPGPPGSQPSTAP